MLAMVIQRLGCVRGPQIQEGPICLFPVAPKSVRLSQVTLQFLWFIVPRTLPLTIVHGRHPQQHTSEAYVERGIYPWLSWVNVDFSFLNSEPSESQASDPPEGVLYDECLGAFSKPIPLPSTAALLYVTNLCAIGNLRISMFLSGERILNIYIYIFFFLGETSWV